MLSSCTTLTSWAPPAPRKSAAAAAPALQLLRSRQPAAAAASVAALRWASRKESRRAPLFVCHAQGDNKYKYDIQPSALVHPREKNDGDWRLSDEEDQITLKFMVGETSKEKLEVATTEDKVLLIIRYKQEQEDKSGSSSPAASSLDVRLLIPPGYDTNKMQGIMWNTGWLEISIPKPKRERKTIDISTPPAPAQ